MTRSSKRRSGALACLVALGLVTAGQMALIGTANAATPPAFSAPVTIPLTPPAANDYVDGVAVDKAAGTVFVADADANGVWVVGEAGQPGPVFVSLGQPGHGYPYSLAYDDANNTVYVATSGSVVPINATSLSVGTPISLGGGSPNAIAVDPATGLVFVANSNVPDGQTCYSYFGFPICTNYYAPALDVVDTSNDNVTHSFLAQASGSPPAANGVAVDTATGHVFVTLSSNQVLEFPDSSNPTSIGTITVGSNPYGVAVDPTTGLVFVANSGSGTVSVINDKVSQPTVVGTVTVASGAFDVASDPGEGSVFVTSGNTHAKVSVIDETLGQSSGWGGADYTSVTVGSTPLGVAVDTGNHHVFVANRDTTTLSEFTPTFPTRTVETVGSATYSAASQQVPVSASVTSGGNPVDEGSVVFTVYAGSSATDSALFTSPAIPVTAGAAGTTVTLPADQAPGTYLVQAAYNDPSGSYGSSIDDSKSLSLLLVAACQNSPYYGTGADLAGQSFRGRALSGRVLTGANLTGADLFGTNLSGADLRGADLQGANLTGVNLNGADLAGANLYAATLRGVNLQSADASCADLESADLTGVNLHAASLAGDNLDRAAIDGSNLQGAGLQDATLLGATLRGVNLHDVLWSATTCPDGTSSNTDGGTCQGHG